MKYINTTTKVHLVCMSYQQTQQERNPIYCRNKCGIEICFDSRKSKSGKSIPIDKSSNLPHQCPKSKYMQRQQEASGSGKVVTSGNEEQFTILNTKLELIFTQLQRLADLHNERIEGSNA